MSELKRICTKKALMILILIVVLNILMFFISLPQGKEITLQGDELKSYIQSYPQFIENVKNQGNSISILSIYADDFSKNNIEKTMADYESLGNVKLTAADNRAVVVWSDYAMGDMILLGLMLVLVISFGSDNSKGLTMLIRSTKNGRLVLYKNRILSLFICSIFLAIILSASTLIAAFASFGEINLLMPLQSIPEFMRSCYKISVLSYIVLSVLIKAFSVFSISVIVYFIMLVFKNSLFVAVSVVVMAIELLLSVTILETSSINHLRFINLFTLLKTDVFFKEYLNLNFFSAPVNFLLASISFVAFVVIAVIIIGAVICEKKYFLSKSSVSSVIVKLKDRFHRLVPTGGVMYYEAKKLLINQAVLAVGVVLFVMVHNSLTAYEYVYAVDENVERWYNTFSGEINEDLKLDIEDKLSEYQGYIDYYENAIKEEQSKPEPSDRRIQELYTFLMENKTQKAAIEVVYENVVNGIEYTQKSGVTIHNIKPFSWSFLLREDKNTVNTASLYILLFIIFASCGVFSYESQNNMSKTIRTLHKGRLVVTAVKLIYISVISAFFATFVHLIQYNMIGEILKYENLSSPVQSLMFMREFPIVMSIKAFIILLFILRAVMAVIASLITALISKYTPDRLISLVVSVFILAIPSMLLTASLDFPLSLINLLGGLFII